MILPFFLLSLSFLIPNHYLPWMSFYSEYLAFGFIIISWLWLSGQKCQVGVSSLFLVALGFIPLAQWGGGIVYFSGDAWISAFYLWAAALAVMVGRTASALYGETIQHALAWTLALTASISCAIAVAQWLGVADGLLVLTSGAGRRVTANLAQSNHLATLLMLGVASVFYLRQNCRVSAWSAGLWVLFLLLGAVLTQSRTAWLCFLLFGMWWFFKLGRQSLIAPAAVVAWFLFLMLGAFWVSDLAVFLRLIEPSAEVDFVERATSRERLAIWGQAWHAIVVSPFWGYGVGQVSVAQVESAIDYPVQLLSLHAHNIVLDVLLWCGVVVGVPIVAFWVWRVVRLLVAAESPASVYLSMCIGSILLHGMLEYPLEYSYFLLPLLFMLGVLEEKHGAWLMLLPRYSSLIVWFVALFLMVWVWREYRVIEEDHRSLRFELARIGGVRALKEAPDVHLLSQLREMHRLARTVPRSGISEDQMVQMQAAAFRYPYVPSLYRYAQVLALNGRADRAVDVLKRLRSIYGPRSFADVKLALREAQRTQPGFAEVNEMLERVN